jgi:ABC-type polysaccharide/polyol phosphate export permease
VATQLVAFVVMTGIVIVLAMIVLPDSRSTAWLAIPVGAVIVLFVSGLSLAIASANAIYRDIEFVVAALLLPLFFLTPVLYSLDNLPVAETHPWLIDLIQWGNPLTPLVECFRTPLFYGEIPSTGDLVYLLVETVVALVLGAAVFSSVDDRIAAEL